MSKFSTCPHFFRIKKKKNCKDFSVGQDLTKFVKIPTLESLIYIYIFLKKDKDILRILIGLMKNSSGTVKLKKH
jgi:hypothetical protein